MCEIIDDTLIVCYVGLYYTCGPVLYGFACLVYWSFSSLEGGGGGGVWDDCCHSIIGGFSSPGLMRLEGISKSCEKIYSLSPQFIPTHRAYTCNSSRLSH